MENVPGLTVELEMDTADLRLHDHAWVAEVAGVRIWAPCLRCGVRALLARALGHGDLLVADLPLGCCRVRVALLRDAG